MKHFKLRTDLSIQHEGKTLYRIEATKDFNYIKMGDLGGYIEKEGNLSGNAWVSENALVYGNAWVSENALVFGDAQVSGNAWVYGNAQVFGDTQVYRNARVFGNALVYGNARVFGNALVYGNAQVFGKAQVFGDTQVYRNAQVYGNATITMKMSINTANCYINIIGTKHTTTISLTGIVVGCKNYKNLKDFENRYKQDGKDNCYTDFELEYLYISIKNGLKLIKKLNKKEK